jgi:hypothetical protein
VFYQSFLADWEGVQVLDDKNQDSPGFDETEQLLAEMELEDEGEQFTSECFTTTQGEVKGAEIMTILRNNATSHILTGCDQFNADTSRSNARYSEYQFQGIIIDTGASGLSTVGLPQLKALQKLMPDIILDTSGIQQTVRFGIGQDQSLGTVNVPTPIGTITFHVVPADTPFLMCIQDMDNMGVKIDNLQNLLIQRGKTVPIVRKWGHPFMLLGTEGIDMEQTIAMSHLTEVELRQLHRRFGHPSVQRLVRILERAGHDIEH